MLYEEEPNAMAAFREAKVGTYDVPEILLPALSLAENEILVRVEVMMEDPLDWKNIDTVTQEYTHSTHGCDFSGIVVKLGRSVACGVSLGDHVVGFVLTSVIHRVTHTTHGVNTSYVRIEGELAWVVPKGTFSHEEAAKARLGRFRYMFGVSSV